MKMPLSVKNQSIETSGLTKDYREAICEYIWNGYEANATEVKISYLSNSIYGINSITVSDNGDGINYDTLADSFGAFLASQKNSLSLRLKSKANKGKGRFSFCAFSSLVEWHTRYLDNNQIKEYTITLSKDNKELFDYDEATISNEYDSTGTSVTFYNVFGIDAGSLSIEALEDYLLSEFAWYLYLNKHKNIKLYLNEHELDYNKHINSQFSQTVSKTINDELFEISLIVWNERIKEKFRSYYFDSKNTIKGIDTTTFNRNTVDFNHSVFIQSSFFDKWQTVSLFDKSLQIDFFKNEEDNKIIKQLKVEMQAIITQKLNQYMSSKADEEIDRMINERKTFPKFADDEYGALRKKDLTKVTKEIYRIEPRIFYKLKDVQEKSLLAFLNLLLNSEERENILTVIEEIIQLTAEQRAQFADVLKKTKLENIIATIEFIENRYKIIELLKQIIYGLDTFANERDHIQKIIEQNYWLFGEQYNLVSSDRNMHRALEQYTYLLYGAKSETENLSTVEESNRRMDIFLSGARKVENSFGNFVEENIVVELKSPRITLSKTVLRQVEDYMDYIRTNPQFNSQQRQWKFIAVCKETDDFVKSQYVAFKDKGKPGLVYQSDLYEVYALTWDDVFTSFDLRHSFMLDKLNYDRSILIDEYNKLETDKKSRETANNLTNVALNINAS